MWRKWAIGRERSIFNRNRDTGTCYRLSIRRYSRSISRMSAFTELYFYLGTYSIKFISTSHNHKPSRLLFHLAHPSSPLTYKRSNSSVEYLFHFNMAVDAVSTINYLTSTTDELSPWLIEHSVPATVRSNFVQTPVPVKVHDLRDRENTVNIDCLLYTSPSPRD